MDRSKSCKFPETIRSECVWLVFGLREVLSVQHLGMLLMKGWMGSRWISSQTWIKASVSSWTVWAATWWQWTQPWCPHRCLHQTQHYQTTEETHTPLIRYLNVGSSRGTSGSWTAPGLLLTQHQPDAAVGCWRQQNLQTQLVLPKATWAPWASFVATIKHFLIGVILLITSSFHLFLSQSHNRWWNRLIMIVGFQKWDLFYSLMSQKLNWLINFDWRFPTGLSTANTTLMGLHIHVSQLKFLKEPWRRTPSLPQAATAAADLLEASRCAAHAWSGSAEILQLSSRHRNIWTPSQSARTDLGILTLL